MGQNRAFDRPFMVMGGLVKTAGGSNNLVKGQLALVNNRITTTDGVAAVASPAGVAKKDKVFELRLGISDKGIDRSKNNLAQATKVFSLEEVVGLEVSAPKITEQKYDEIVLGYDGFDESTAFKFKPSDAFFRVSLEIKGGALEYRGGGMPTECVSVNIQVPNCDPFENCVDCDECAQIDCREIVQEAIEVLRRRQLTGGMLVEEVVDITPVFSCEDSAATVNYQYWTLSVCDTGTDEALSLVAAQYDAPVIRIDRKGSTSVYQVMLAQGVTPADYEQSVASVIKGCSDCPAGYDAATGGYLYAFTIEDDGADLSATFDGIANHVAGSTVKSGNSNGVGYYTALYTVPLSQSVINTLIGGAAPNNTITVSLVGDAADICNFSGSLDTTAWVAGEVCGAIEETYSIVLPDNECGQDRLAELNGAYPGLTITIADSVNSTLTATVDTGTAGQTSNVSVGGVDYEIAFDTDFATTAGNFVTAHAAAILAASGVTVTNDGAVLTFNGLTATINAITITGDVAWTGVTAVDPDRRACQTRYQTTVVSNIVCEECDTVFKDYYVTEAPQSFGQEKWKLQDNSVSNSACLCGIKFKAKPFILAGEEALRDDIGFVETSSRIRVSADYPTEIREGIGELPTSTAPTRQLSKQQHRTHLAGNLRDLENESRSYFRGLAYYDSYLSRLLTGTTSNFEDQFKQYVQYTLKVRHNKLSQGFGGEHVENINYPIFVEVGKHTAVEDLLNSIAANAGVPTVQAFA